MPNIDLNSLSDDDVGTMGVQPITPAKAPDPKAIDIGSLSDADLAGAQTGDRPGMTTGTLRALEQGATFGFGDELNAFLRSQGMWAGSGKGENYDQALADERRQNAQFHEDHPYISTGAEIAGSLPMMVAPGMQGLNGMRYLQDANSVAQAARRSAGIGAAYGTVSGFGHGEGGAGERAFNAGMTAVPSAVLGGALGAGAYKIGEVRGGINAAREEAGANGNVPAAALNALAKSFRNDKIDPVQDIIHGQMLPATTGRTGLTALTPEQMQDAITQYNAGNITQQQLANQFGVSPGAISNVLSRFAENTTTPMTIVDRAKMVRPGSGINTEWRMRGAAATPGDARREAMENLTDRQLGQYSRLMDATNQYVGDGTDASIAKAQATLKASENAAYAKARASQVPFDINPVLNKYNQVIQQVKPSSTIGKSLSEALNNFYDETSVANPLGTNYMKQLTPVQGLERFQGAKENLDDAIDASLDPKTGAATNLTRYLNMLKDDMMNVVRQSNPDWATANDTFTGAGRAALKAGESMPLRLGSKSRDVEKMFAGFEKMAANKDPDIAAAGNAQIDLFRQGMSRAIQDGLQNKGQTNDLARTLLTPGAKRVMERVLGQQNADRYTQLLQQEQTGTSTFNKLRGGSQTTPLKEEIDPARAPDIISSLSDLRHPMELLSRLGQWGAGKLYADRNAALMKHMANMDPVEQMNTLRSVNTVAQGRQVAGGNMAGNSMAIVPAGQAGVAAQEQSSLKGGIGPRYDESANYIPGQDQKDMKKKRGYADGGLVDDPDDTGGIMPYLESNPHGIGDSPLKFGQSEGEIRNPDDPYAGTGGPSMPAQMAYDLSGIPSTLEGVRLGREGANEGDPTKMLQGMGDVALGAAPAATMRMPAAALRTGAKIAGIGGAGALGAAALSDVADARNRRSQQRQDLSKHASSNAPAPNANASGPDPYAELRSQAGTDPKALALLSAYIAQDQASRQNVQGVNSASSDDIRTTAAGKADGLRNQLIDRIQEMNAAKEPFDKAYPSTAKVLPWIGTLAPFVAGAALGYRGSMPPGGWQRAIDAAEREGLALNTGRPVEGMFSSRPADPNIRDYYTTKAQNFQDAFNNKGLAQKLSEEAVPAVLGASIGYESRAFPYQYNQRQTPENSPEHQAADKYLSEPQRSLWPAFWGALGGWSGKHFGSAFAPKTASQNAATGALDAIRGQSPSSGASGATSGGPTAPGGPTAGSLSAPPEMHALPGPEKFYPGPSAPRTPNPDQGLGSAPPALPGPARSQSAPDDTTKAAGTLGEASAAASGAADTNAAASKRNATKDNGSQAQTAASAEAGNENAALDPDTPKWKQLGLHHSSTQPRRRDGTFKKGEAE